MALRIELPAALEEGVELLLELRRDRHILAGVAPPALLKFALSFCKRSPVAKTAAFWLFIVALLAPFVSVIAGVLFAIFRSRQRP